ncbi:hypothetical protein A6A08_07405 [Nocardiopsis sp. TSRI0078]|uniref:hypothetical protein n=1 Tax=unclassified Nocardiopsis TaxID=2649073 RepID=UPI00093AC03F|nr:hypothetical protein [Nocardiopsis sp. TSRI0078]OKI17076.1 hypothetical protein A6A08_07405 [Nocardiopsis sp. TSRI0078]
MSENATPSRLSIDPALPEHTLLALRRTPEEWEEQRRQMRKSSKEFDWIGAGAALFVFMGILFATDDPAVAIGVFVLMAVVGKGGTSIWLSHREGLLERLLQENAERCVDPAHLHARERDLLVRAQRAVARILGSPLHERGILNDRAQEEVVLNDVEWSIARQVLSQSERRHRIGAVPVSGDRSRQAAARALASLDREQEETVRQIDTIVRMADQVVEAERELVDRAHALRLDDIRVEDPWIHAAAKVDSESLDSLSRARDTGQHIAGLLASREGPAALDT